MSALEEKLETIAHLPGVKGAAIFTPDGVLVASYVRGVDGEALAALASQLLKQLGDAAAHTGLGSPRRICLRAVFGAVAFRRLEELVLLAAVEPQADLDSLWPALEEAAASMPRMASS